MHEKLYKNKSQHYILPVYAIVDIIVSDMIDLKLLQCHDIVFGLKRTKTASNPMVSLDEPESSYTIRLPPLKITLLGIGGFLLHASCRYSL